MCKLPLAYSKYPCTIYIYQDIRVIISADCDIMGTQYRQKGNRKSTAGLLGKGIFPGITAEANKYPDFQGEVRHRMLSPLGY